MAACGLLLVACGGGSTSTDHTHRVQLIPKTLHVYSALPAQGPSAAGAMVNAIKLALRQAGGRAGRFKINYVPLDEPATAGGPGIAAAASDARRVAADSRTIFFIGELDEEASAIFIPALRVAGIPQVYVPLASRGATRALPKRPPPGSRSYLRLVPGTSAEAGALLIAMRQSGCTRVAIASDNRGAGAELARLLELQRRRYGVDLVSNTVAGTTLRNPRAYALRIKAEGANCFQYSGAASSAAVEVTRAVNSALPRAKIFGSDAACVPAWTNPARGGLPPSIGALLECTRPALSTAAYPGGRRFLSDYRAVYGPPAPGPYAIFGYEAMKLGLDTIRRLGSSGADKSTLSRALAAITARASVLGTYGFDRNGVTTLRSYGLYRVGRGGDPVFYRTITVGQPGTSGAGPQ